MTDHNGCTNIHDETENDGKQTLSVLNNCVNTNKVVFSEPFDSKAHVTENVLDKIWYGNLGLEVCIICFKRRTDTVTSCQKKIHSKRRNEYRVCFIRRVTYNFPGQHCFSQVN